MEEYFIYKHKYVNAQVGIIAKNSECARWTLHNLIRDLEEWTFLKRISLDEAKLKYGVE